MSVNIKYKNNSIAELADTGTKALKTAGKYCEADIVVENTQDGGTDAEDGIVTRAITTYTNNRVQSIGGYAFYGCSALTSVNLPAVTTIGNFAFGYCSALTSVVLRKTDTICTLSSTFAFNNTPIKSGTGYIYVPDALVDQYKAATNWSTYAANIKPLSEYTEV